MLQRENNKVFYKQKLNRITEYIHNNLDKKISISTLAEISHFSPYHFHRISRALLGEPIGVYISRIRIETAAKMIRYSKLPIEDIAYSVGYDAPSSLSKAFKNHFNIPPIYYRKHRHHTIKTTNIMEVSLNIKKPKILTIDNKYCLFYSMQGAYQTLDYANAWAKLWNEVKTQKLFTAGIEHIGLPFDDPNVTDDEKIRYEACLIIHKTAKPSGETGVKTLTGGAFAVFHYQGSYANFPQVYNFIFNTWLMENNYQLRDEPVREKYLNNPNKTEESKLKTEIYIPII
ncbi:helix-turn-helix domain-containing protein [Flavobacteriaceae bacterium AU392]|nr:AraC family transcriptional regulator [Flavobacteriaceae bacterium]RKM85414.1 helix-turn-helix domain-containing protein [Flavobacteriaceae bacterium AU392]